MNPDVILARIESLLPKDAEGNFLAFKPGATGAEEKSDVVHDFLAFLAEQMMEMNKEKHAEVTGFLSWLEREIGAKIEDLSNKTKLKEYDDQDFDTVLGVLRRNRSRLRANPDSRQLQEALEREFTASVARLCPLRARIAATDRLIDLIVYRLYGLTPEEIEAVEQAQVGQS